MNESIVTALHSFLAKEVANMFVTSSLLLHHCMNNCTTLGLIVLLLFPLCACPFSFEPRFSQNAHDMFYDGDATAFRGAIELTASYTKSSVGQASCAQPVHLWDASTGMLADFTSRFSFIIDIQGYSIYADGIGFFLAPVEFQIPPNSAAGYLGMFTSSAREPQVVVVEFDSYNNTWDPPAPHIGIDNEFVSSDAHAEWKVNGTSGKKADALVTYNATTKNLSVSLTYENDPDLRGNSTSLVIDLTHFLPEWVRVGFSAATGDNYQKHTILSWHFESNLDSKLAIIGGRNDRQKTLAIILVSGAVVLSVLMLLGLGYFVFKRRRAMTKIASLDNITLPDASMNTDLERKALPRRFTYEELASATNNFANHMRLGQGGSGHVYKGVLNDLGRVVAVKRIFTGSAHAGKIFTNEAKIISRLIHRNLVQFIGWCHEEGNFLLVYEYMPNGSLDTHLFGYMKALPWNVRYKIALGLASAIQYLHEDAEQCVLHRDIKSANVLLDNDFNTKLGDFGVAKLVDPRLRTQMTGLVGTLGYMAPEYAAEGRASKESDMFSFGIVALEIACGRKTFQDGDTHMPLAKWVWQLHLEGDILKAADERLSMEFESEEMKCLLMVGLWCAHPKDKERPKVGQVISYLRLEAPVPELPSDNMPHLLFTAAPSLPHSHVDSVATSLSSSLDVGR